MNPSSDLLLWGLKFLRQVHLFLWIRRLGCLFPSASQPNQSGASLSFSGPSTIGEDPSTTLAPPLMIGTLPLSDTPLIGPDPLHTYTRCQKKLAGPSSTVADPPTLTYSRRTKLPPPPAAADPVSIPIIPPAPLCASSPLLPPLPLSSVAGTSQTKNFLPEASTPASVSVHPMTTRLRDNSRRSKIHPDLVTYLTTNHPLPPTSSPLVEPTTFT